MKKTIYEKKEFIIGRGVKATNFIIAKQRIEEKDMKNINSIIREKAEELEKEVLKLIRNKGIEEKFNELYFTKFKEVLEKLEMREVYNFIYGENLRAIGRFEFSSTISKEFENSIERAFRKAGVLKGATKDQLPDIILISNIETDLNYLFYSFFPGIREEKQIEGIFGAQGEIRKERHMEEDKTKTEDFSQYAYMVNHLAHSGKIPMLMFLGDRERFELLIKRREDFINRAKKSRALIVKGDNFDIGIVKRIKGKNTIIPVPLVLYSPKEREFYVYHTEGKKKGEFEEFGKWLENNKEYIGEHVDKIRKKLSMHKNDKYAYVVHLLRRTYQKFCCVDARHNVYAMAQIVKELGGIPKEGEIRRAMKHDYTLEHQIELHTGCGYITALSLFHDLFKWIKENMEKEEVDGIKEQIKEFIRSVREGKSYLVSLSEEYDELFSRAGKDIEKAYKMLFRNDKADYQFILYHMVELGLFDIEELESEEVKKADRLVKKAEFKNRVYILTEIIAKKIKERIERVRDELIKEGFARAKDARFSIVIRSLRDERYRIIPGEPGKGIFRETVGGGKIDLNRLV